MGELDGGRFAVGLDVQGSRGNGAAVGGGVVGGALGDGAGVGGAVSEGSVQVLSLAGVCGGGHVSEGGCGVGAVSVSGFCGIVCLIVTLVLLYPAHLRAGLAGLLGACRHLAGHASGLVGAVRSVAGSVSRLFAAIHAFLGSCSQWLRSAVYALVQWCSGSLGSVGGMLAALVGALSQWGASAVGCLSGAGLCQALRSLGAWLSSACFRAVQAVSGLGFIGRLVAAVVGALRWLAAACGSLGSVSQ